MNKAQGIAFKAKREKDKLSAKKLADRLGTTRENIYQWERGTEPNSKEMQKKLKEYIGGAIVAESKQSNGTVPHEDFKQKYYTLLEKYTALLEKKP